MNIEVSEYLKKLPEWQIAVCNSLRNLVHETIPDVTERMQYGKPHYLKNGHYAAVISVAKDKVSFMLFHAAELSEIKGFFKSTSTPDRKTATITNGQQVDYTLLAGLLAQASASL
ncbi:hypothetical protein DYBT9275_00360 [Dyadobacter sp. CECT 9275]|uniref:YdhG-like domain-containing protein n=1 Tax=Dyadobacter helix TaxID=2822344 RepID=A0A916J8F0_9BACT|nr:DUF1801 domain-containing protein [Dyadobacter sp. CECT 9275]CAG4989732.1 hypothetical protein DYBT9275_00360 [Dyadobacter sp. CECT 9275]